MTPPTQAIGSKGASQNSNEVADNQYRNNDRQEPTSCKHIETGKGDRIYIYIYIYMCVLQ